MSPRLVGRIEPLPKDSLSLSSTFKRIALGVLWRILF